MYNNMSDETKLQIDLLKKLSETESDGFSDFDDEGKQSLEGSSDEYLDEFDDQLKFSYKGQDKNKGEEGSSDDFDDLNEDLFDDTDDKELSDSFLSSGDNGGKIEKRTVDQMRQMLKEYDNPDENLTMKENFEKITGIDVDEEFRK